MQFSLKNQLLRQIVKSELQNLIGNAGDKSFVTFYDEINVIDDSNHNIISWSCVIDIYGCD